MGTEGTGQAKVRWGVGEEDKTQARPPRGFCGGELGLWAVPRSWVQLPLSILCDLEQVPDLSGASVFPDLL